MAPPSQGGDRLADFLTSRKRPVPIKKDPFRNADPAVQGWLKHFSAKEKEPERPKTVISPRALARHKLVLQWYEAGALPWEVGAG
jgi:hypothetical protein